MKSTNACGRAAVVKGMTDRMTRRRGVRGSTLIGVVALASSVAIAQAPPPPAPVVVGRDIREGGQVIGKQYALRVRLLDVLGPGVQQVRVVRVAADGNVTLPRIAPLKAEGVALATLEAQATAAYKAIAPTAAAFISIADRTPPAPPPPPPAPPPPPTPPASPATQVVPATQAAVVTTHPTTKAVAAAAPATQPAPPAAK